MHYFLSRFLLGISILQSLSLFTIAYINNWNLEVAVLIGTLTALLAGIGLERVIPYKKSWNANHDDFKTDAVSAITLVAIIDPALKLIGPIAVVAAHTWFNIGESTLLSEMPLPAQIILVTLLAELGRYWSHRLHHFLEPLWWLHAMHHSSKRLYVINNLRFNPLNYILNFLIGMLPILFLMPSPQALLGYLALTQPVLMLQHANIDLKSGWLNYIFSTNELHRWHHSTDSTKANSNFGNAIVLWDQIFGTFRIESVLEGNDSDVGLFESSRNYPGDAGYLQQVFSIVKMLRKKS